MKGTTLILQVSDNEPTEKAKKEEVIRKVVYNEEVVLQKDFSFVLQKKVREDVEKSKEDRLDPIISVKTAILLGKAESIGTMDSDQNLNPNDDGVRRNRVLVNSKVDDLNVETEDL